jgi:hypothetical protein
MHTAPFSFRTMVIGKQPLETIFILAPDDRTSAQDVDVSITRLLRDGNISPDLIVFVYLRTDKEIILPMFKSTYVLERIKGIHRCKVALTVQIDDEGLFVSDGSIWGGLVKL